VRLRWQASKGFVDFGKKIWRLSLNLVNADSRAVFGYALCSFW